jgi:hypothetical protein
VLRTLPSAGIRSEDLDGLFAVDQHGGVEAADLVEWDAAATDDDREGGQDLLVLLRREVQLVEAGSDTE